MLYALTVYQARAKAIRERTGAPYDDRLGPVSSLPTTQLDLTDSQTILCIALLGMHRLRIRNRANVQLPLSPTSSSAPSTTTRTKGLASFILATPLTNAPYGAPKSVLRPERIKQPYQLVVSV